MANTYFQFKQFLIHQDHCAMKVTTDACLFGAWVADLLGKENFATALDIGTGTGLLSLMAVQKCKLTIDAVELDAAAAEQAHSNVAASPWPESIRVVQSDILQFDLAKKYGVIISNPPFYEGELKSAQDNRNRAHHSSDLALAQVIAQIRERLEPHGRFFLLLPFKRQEEILEQLSAQDLYPQIIVTVKPSTQQAPFRLMITGGFQESPTLLSELNIWDEHRQYTNEFLHLLKDYYLYL